jgi:hypothetical protein
MNGFRNAMLYILGGGLLGTWAAGYFGSRFIPWYNEPGVQGAALCPCGEVTTKVANSIIHAQAWGLLIGASIGLCLYVLVAVRGRNRPRPEAPAGSTSSPTA